MKDQTLNNIAYYMRSRHIKVENMARALGISAGEFSKILNGQRKHYHKHLPGIAAYLNIDLQALSVLDAGGKSDSPQNHCKHCAQQNGLSKPEHFDAILQSKDELIASLKEMIQMYKQQMSATG